MVVVGRVVVGGLEDAKVGCGCRVVGGYTKGVVVVIIVVVVVVIVGD